MQTPQNTAYNLSGKHLLEEMSMDNLAAFNSLYKQHIRSLLHYGRKITQDQDLIKDAVHDLFTDLWQRRHALEHIECIEFYLMKSLRYKLIKPRPGKVYKELKEEDVVYLPQTFIDDIIGQKESFEITSKQLQQAIEQLPERQREMIYLRFYKGYSHRQVAELMQINYQSASNLLQRTIEALKKQMPENYSLETFTSMLFCCLHFF